MDNVLSEDILVCFVIQSTFMSNNKHIDDLAQIRAMMEKSSRFISLSGLSGVLAGIYALIGAMLAYFHFEAVLFHEECGDCIVEFNYVYLFGVAISVMVLSLITGFVLTAGRAKKKGQNVFDKSALRLVVNTGFPIVVGGIFCLILFFQGSREMIGPCMLIFYGLGLINGSKYTLDGIRYLGVVEVLLGLVAAITPGYGLFLWACGFGIMHIAYGAFMYLKFESGK